jgi:hypothetical protein
MRNGLQIVTDPPGYCLCAWLYRRIFDSRTDLSKPPSQASAHRQQSGGRIEREALHLERYLPARNRHLYGRLGLAYRLDRPAGLLVASLTLPRADQRGNRLVDVRLCQPVGGVRRYTSRSRPKTAHLLKFQGNFKN